MRMKQEKHWKKKDFRFRRHEHKRRIAFSITNRIRYTISHRRVEEEAGREVRKSHLFLRKTQQINKELRKMLGSNRGAIQQVTKVQLRQ